MGPVPTTGKQQQFITGYRRRMKIRKYPSNMLIRYGETFVNITAYGYIILKYTAYAEIYSVMSTCKRVYTCMCAIDSTGYETQTFLTPAKQRRTPVKTLYFTTKKKKNPASSSIKL